MSNGAPPQVTFALFTYNQEAFVMDALNAAFAQDYTPLEILVSDDCSSDRTFEVLSSLVGSYDGPHSVRLVRNPERVGIARHINNLTQMAAGDLIVIAAGDDISRADRARKIAELWCQLKCPDVSIHSGYTDMDTDGTKLRDVIRAQKANGASPLAMLRDDVITGATHAWTKGSFRTFGPLHAAVTHEDRVIGLRSSLLSGVFYVDEALVAYRRGGISGKGELNRFELVRRAARRYIVDLCQMIADLDVAVNRGLIGEPLFEKLSLIASGRLSRFIRIARPASPGSTVLPILLEEIRLLMRKLWRFVGGQFARSR